MPSDTEQPAAPAPGSVPESAPGSSDAGTDAATKGGKQNDAASSPTQAVRRTAFSLNVLVAVAAVVGLVVVLNWVGNLTSHRFDLTATREHSLAPQTTKLLKSLDAPYEMITLLSTQSVATASTQDNRILKARDLADDYGRHSTNIRVRHIDPDIDVDQLRALYKQLHDRFGTELKPAREAAEQGLKALNEIKTAVGVQAAKLDELLSDAGMNDPKARRQFEQAKATFELLATEGTNIAGQIERSMDTPMPDYAGQLAQLQGMLSNVSTRAMQPMTAAFDELANDRRQSNAVIDEALGMVDYTERTSVRINDTLSALSRVKVPDAYTRLLTDSVNASNAVLVLGPEGTQKAQFVTLTDMFVGATRTDDDTPQEPVFKGEGLLTAAIIRMQMAVPPLVVFAYSGSTPAIGQGGPYNALAQRLESAGFDVVQWNPLGQRTPGNAPTPAAPPPTPRANQKAVWIFPPLAQPQSTNPMPTGADRVAQLARDRMDAGDGVLLMVHYDAAARFSSTDPFVQLLRTWGIEAELGKLILHEVKVDEKRSETLARMTLRQWPDALPITRAMAGLPGFTLAASPLTVAKEKSPNVTIWPLIEVREDRQWAEAELGGDRMPSFKQEHASEVFNIALAAEHEGRRLVAISDPAFGMDTLVTMGRDGRPGTADRFGAAFPANAELLVNSAYWLADLDDLIAASARTQDIRRIEPMTPRAYSTVQIGLLAGLPALTLIVGLSVWLVRRRA